MPEYTIMIRTGLNASLWTAQLLTICFHVFYILDVTTTFRLMLSDTEHGLLYMDAVWTRGSILNGLAFTTHSDILRASLCMP